MPACARRAAGFTLIELLIVVALIAVASGVATLALRDPAATHLEQEAARLTALLEAARSESRASGISVTWEPRTGTEPDAPRGFRFVGLAASSELPSHWLDDNVSAEILGSRTVLLGPEPMIGPQRIVLRLADRRLQLSTDGLGPFVVEGDPAPVQ